MPLTLTLRNPSPPQVHSVPSWLVGDALALRALVYAQRAQLLEQQAQLDELSATVAGLRAQAQAAAASSA